MTEKNLDNQHPDYRETLEARTKSRDLYDGWRAVKGAGLLYLFKEPRELEDDYALRLKRAVLDNWVEKIVQARQAVIFRKEPTRKLPKAVSAYLDDVDRNGTGAEAFFEEAALESQIDGIHWVLVDMPEAPEDGHRSLAEEKDSAHRPFFEHIPAENVIDWEIGSDGKLSWAVVRQIRHSERPEPGSSAQTVDQWKVWYRDKWEIYERAGDAKDRAISLRASGPNTSNVVPLVPFFGVKRTEQSGFPVVEKLIEHIVLIYNKRSDLDRSERIAAHPIPVIMSPEKFEVLNMSNGIWIDTSKAAGVPVDVKILETSGVAFDSIRTSIAALEYTIRVNALAQAKRDSAQVESAESQREYKATFNSSLRSASVNYENSERRCWDIWGLWINTAVKPESVIYNRDFDDNTIDQQMISRLYELAGSKPVITRRTLLQTLQRGEIVSPELDVEAEILALNAEETSAADELAKSLVPVAQKLPPEPST